MGTAEVETITVCHVVALPYLGRGHTIPNIIPSEHSRAKDFAAFLEAAWTKMEAPVEQLLDGLEQPVTAIAAADTFLVWALRVERNISVASLWTPSPTMFSMLHHFELSKENGHFPLDVSVYLHIIYKMGGNSFKSSIFNLQSSYKKEMGTMKVEPITVSHLVALPYPGRGHINPMMNLCKQLSSKNPQLLITFVVTEEWRGFIESNPKPENIRLATIPNVIPSEHGRAKDFAAFVEAVWTKLEAPVEQLLDGLEQPVTAIVADTYLVWAVRVGNRRNIPLASLWTQSPTMFSVLHHFELFKENGHFALDVSECGDEIVEYIPGVSTTCIADLPAIFFTDDPIVVHKPLEAVYEADKAQYLLFTSVYELDPQVFEALKAKFAFPIYPIGPSIPHFELSKTLPTNQNDIDYLHWLDSQPKKSVLYFSMGSFLSVSKSQMDEIVAGVKSSGVRVFWVARGDACELRDFVGDLGLVVPWCNQLRVLCHDSIGGFWSHCGWNSTLEAVYAGLPILTFPIFWDQIPNGKQIVEDWRIGYRVKKKVGVELLVSSEEIGEIVKKFMDVESEEGKDLRERAKQLQKVCRGAIANGGSSDRNLDAFLKDISQGHNCH